MFDRENFALVIILIFVNCTLIAINGKVQILIKYTFKGSKIEIESLIVLKNIGIIIEKKHINGKIDKTFVDKGKVRNFIIHEKLTPYDIYYSMACTYYRGDISLFNIFPLNINRILI